MTGRVSRETVASAVRVRSATSADVDAIKRIADGARRCVGCVPRASIERAVLREEVIVAVGGEDITGFCHFYRRRDGVHTLYHLAVAPEKQRQGIGRALVELLAADARARGAEEVRLKCPEDLDANFFYARMGFKKVGAEGRTGRPLSVWVLRLLG